MPIVLSGPYAEPLRQNGRHGSGRGPSPDRPRALAPPWVVFFLGFRVVPFGSSRVSAEGEGYELRGKAMRSAIIATLSVLATLAVMPAVATAQNDQNVANPSYEPANHAPMVRDENNSDGTARTPEQEGKIPYHPCKEALGWVNGRLQCRND
jgi:hypothetical protein